MIRESIVPATVLGNGRVMLVGNTLVINDVRVPLSKRDIELALVYFAGLLRYDLEGIAREFLEKRYPEVYGKLDKVLEEAERPRVYASVNGAYADCSMLVARVNMLNKEIMRLDSEYEQVVEVMKALDKLIETLQKYDPSLRAVDTHLIWG